MAHFVFENDLNSILKLDAPITNAPPARWQRKAKEGNCSSANTSVNTSVLSPMKAANRSHSSSKTPSKTPVLTLHSSVKGKEGRDSVLICHVFLQEQQKAWAVNLNGFDMEDAKILKLGGKPVNAPEGYQNNLKVLYSQKATPGSSKKPGRYIPSMPDRVLDAPEIRNDYYLNLIDWSSQNLLAVALNDSVYLWNYLSGDIILLLQIEHSEEYISSVSWIKEGNYLAVGTSNAEVQHHVATLSGHSQEVCGLKWSPDGRYLASGANDNLVNIWPCVQGDSGEFTPVQTFTQHQGAVKAVAWCPWQSNVLATGGGTSDRHIRIWNVCSGTCLNSVDTHSQVCSILWSTMYKELISGHGFAQNQLVIWKYPTMTRVSELKGHSARVLSLAMSPDGCTVASAAADETLRLWKCFEVDPATKKEKEKARSSSKSIIHQSIR
ncbi:hypothetical protein AB205_0016920 [Aquarana catesbeiana]|uniref:CDC20/Fizzy WD40 domain-containing protein n=1 Tax=Aquarana catesbeiana TaxID=8400 RepID=A0A2G9RHN7_AQUCT|nr:hypothetical protein AB205_0016920 [Aquarana catesbeiana]